MGSRARMRVGGRACATAALATCVALTALAALSGCTGATSSATVTPTPAATHSSSLPTATPAATPVPAVPRLLPHASATANLPYFNSVNEKVLAANPSAVGADFINALVAAGFLKADMQVTADRTTINLPAGSIQFSVRFRGECLIGQNGAGSGGYTSEVSGMLSTGNCLVGQTVPLG
jgi:hypothetical protein